MPDRPNFVTILALVRDATARLPNGEGTRADICQLLKDSQYIIEQDNDEKEGYLHSVVSGALDRLHYEADPCVRYYPRRKEWLYLHRGRSESEFGLFLFIISFILYIVFLHYYILLLQLIATYCKFLTFAILICLCDCVKIVCCIFYRNGSSTITRYCEK